jgi:hypothetical protein
MIAKINGIKIILFLTVFIIINAKITDDNDESKLLESILEGMKNLKIPYKSLDDEIDQKIYLKLLKHLLLNDVDSFGIMSGLEDSFLLKLAKEVTENIPEKIKIKELPKYLNPRLIEPLINKIISEFDINSMLSDLGDALGISDTIKQKMEESKQKDIEREKINQARIKRKQEREKAKLNQNMTNNDNNKDNDTKIGKKYSKRDLRINESDINKDL